MLPQVERCRQLLNELLKHLNEWEGLHYQCNRIVDLLENLNDRLGILQSSDAKAFGVLEKFPQAKENLIRQHVLKREQLYKMLQIQMYNILC